MRITDTIIAITLTLISVGCSNSGSWDLIKKQINDYNTYNMGITQPGGSGNPYVVLSLAGGGTAAENGGTESIRATLSEILTLPVTVNLAFSGTATNVTDYTRSTASIIIPAGSTTGDCIITGVDDLTNEGNETVIVDIDTVVNAIESGTQQVTVIITDNDTQPTVTLSLIGGATIAENGGTTTVRATLSAVSALPVTVNLAFSGTATNVTDYTRSTASIIIPAGSTTGDCVITGVNDLINEGNETVIVDIDSVVNGTESGTQQQTVTITDDDTQPTVTLSLIGGATIAENGGTTAVRATLSAVSGLSVAVNLTFTGTATNISDYTRSTASIVISAGSTTGDCVITGVDDLINEGNETVIVDIDSVVNGTESGTQQQTVTITDDDTQPTVTLSLVGGAVVAENGGTTTVRATLSGMSGFSVTVNLVFSGTATNVTDYTRSIDSIIIPAGSTTGDCVITGVNDLINEGNETVIVDIDSVVNGIESGTQQQTVTITDDDTQPTVTLSLVGGAIVAENGGTTTVRATLSAVSGLAVTVNLAFSGTATNISDYTRSTVSIVISAGSTTGDSVITSVDDLTGEADETVIVDIDSVANGTESGVQQQTVTITDDDRQGPKILSAEYYDIDANGRIDHVKITFDKNVDDSTFDGFNGDNNLGNVTTAWAIAAYNNVRIDTRDSIDGVGGEDNVVIWLAFDEISTGYDTGAKPDLTVTDSSLKELASCNCYLNTNSTDCFTQSAADIATGEIAEADKAAPVIVEAISGVGLNVLKITFSEAVDNAGSICTLLTDNFTYHNDNVGGATGINSFTDSNGCDDNIIIIILNGTTELADINTDKIAAGGIAGSILDPAGNSAGSTEVPIQGVNYQYRIKMTVPAAKVTGTVSDFPVYVNLASLVSVDPNFFDNVKSNGSDIYITSSDGTTKLSRELVYINTTTGEGELWFKAPSLSSLSANDFYIYYKNILGNETNSTAVWSNGYVSVYHLSSGFADSTANSIDGTNYGSTAIAGPIGSAREFNGTTYVEIEASSLLNMNNKNVSVSAWYKPTAAYSSGEERIIFEHNVNWLAGVYQITSYYDYMGDGVHSLAFGYFEEGNEARYKPFNTLFDGNWHYAVGVFNTSEMKTRIYDNGALPASGWNPANQSNQIGNSGTVKSYIGIRGDMSNGWRGYIDEVHVANVVRTADWVATEYSNQNNPSAFFTLGARENLP